MQPEVILGILSAILGTGGLGALARALVQRHFRLIDDQNHRIAEQERARVADKQEMIERMNGLERAVLAGMVGVEKTVEARADEQAERTAAAAEMLRRIMEDRRISALTRAVQGAPADPPRPTAVDDRRPLQREEEQQQTTRRLPSRPR